MREPCRVCFKMRSIRTCALRAAATLRCCRAACAARRGSCRSRTSAATTQTHKGMSDRPQAAGPEGTAGSHLRHCRDVLHRKEGELRHAVVVLAMLRLVDAGAGARVHALHEEVRLRRVVEESPHVPDRLIRHDAGSSQRSATRGQEGKAHLAIHGIIPLCELPRRSLGRGGRGGPRARLCALCRAP